MESVPEWAFELPLSVKLLGEISWVVEVNWSILDEGAIVVRVMRMKAGVLDCLVRIYELFVICQVVSYSVRSL
jgi:hypothetical protein